MSSTAISNNKTKAATLLMGAAFRLRGRIWECVYNTMSGCRSPLASTTYFPLGKPWFGQSSMPRWQAFVNTSSPASLYSRSTKLPFTCSRISSPICTGLLRMMTSGFAGGSVLSNTTFICCCANPLSCMHTLVQVCAPEGWYSLFAVVE